MLIDKDKIKVKLIDRTVLVDIVSNSDPNKETNTGFWLFNETFDKDDNYLNIKLPPLYPEYICCYYEKIPIALCCFSKLYYTKYNKVSKYKKFVKILDMQVLSKYGGNNILNWLYDKLSIAFKKEGYIGYTQVAYSNKQYQKYLKDGFILDNENNCMYKLFNSNKLIKRIKNNAKLIEHIIIDFFTN